MQAHWKEDDPMPELQHRQREGQCKTIKLYPAGPTMGQAGWEDDDAMPELQSGQCQTVGAKQTFKSVETERNRWQGFLAGREVVLARKAGRELPQGVLAGMWLRQG